MKNNILINCALFCFLVGCMIHKEDYLNYYRLLILGLLSIRIVLEYLIQKGMINIKT